MDNEERKQNFGWHFFSMVVYVAVVASSAFILDSLGRLPSEISGFDFFVLILATFRLTRLFVYDSVTDFIRDFFRRNSRTVTELLSCPWCTGIWMALLVGFFYFLTPLAWYPIFLVALAGAGTFIQFTMNRINR
jgi:hypothetical protein